jgi:hypothetical protein
MASDSLAKASNVAKASIIAGRYGRRRGGENCCRRPQCSVELVKSDERSERNIPLT